MAPPRTNDAWREFAVLRSRSGQLPVVLGAGPASALCAVSFADVLDEARDQGYQRPIDGQHSREFRSYIERPGATTIPLTFNLRGREGDGWKLTPGADGEPARLSVRVPSAERAAVLAQVDCQHRLGMMKDCDVPLTFQCFLGLSAKEEMAIFGIINGKAKGLSSSLLDYHTTKLVPGLEMVQLDLYIAKMLNDDSESVWHAKVKLGGAATQGSHRRISLRGLQTATKLLLQRCALGAASEITPMEKYQIVRGFWTAVARVWSGPWQQPRTHLLTKGVGVTALSLLAGDMITAAISGQQRLSADTFAELLSPLHDFDWSKSGPLHGYGGRQGASEAHQLLVSKLFAPGLAIAWAG